MSLLAAIVCQAPDGGTGGLGADGFNDVLLLLLAVGGGRCGVVGDIRQMKIKD